LIKGIIALREPQLLQDPNITGFRVGIDWTRAFIKTELNWSYRASTTAAGKLPHDYEEQGKKMAQRCAYLVKMHNIPPSLVVNTDQTGIHLVPTGGAKTWEEKNSKYVKVHGVDDKRQITVAASSVANGQILPFQVIFQGLTPRTLPPMNEGRHSCEAAGWNLTYSSNHWSTLETCKEFVDKILSSYRMAQIEDLELPTNQEMIWLIDCWSVHISKEFRAWIKKNYPQIHLLFIPANCTSIHQPADVILQRPFKHAFRQEFDKFTMAVITTQLETSGEVKIDTKMSILKPKICGWLFTAWYLLTSKQDMVKKGWNQTGLLRAFEPDFQKQAMIENISTPLFKTTAEDLPLETNYQEDEETCGEVSLDTILEESLTKVSLLQGKSTPTSMVTLRGIARQSSPSAFQNTSR
jgi:hypothetical protein